MTTATYNALFVLLTVTWLYRLVTCISSGQFYGGSISYSLEMAPAGKYLAQVELVTGWVLGNGPCGQSCSKYNVMQSTKTTREAELTTRGDPLYFGNFSSDYEIGHRRLGKDLNNEMSNTYTEIVLAVNEHAMWEQDLLTFTFELEPNTDHEDFNFDGRYWRDLSLQGTGLRWHMQARITTQIRSDTKQPNNCPQVLTRPFYRVKLNAKTTIKIPIIDKDDDIVHCFPAQYIEGGDLSQNRAPGVHIDQKSLECIIEIDTTDSHYSDDVWVAIPVTVRDFNSEPIEFGSEHYDKATSALSSASIQFVVNVKDNLQTPEFVAPTIETNHEFNLFAESTWDLRLYAQSPENTTIDEFVVIARGRESYETSAVHDVPFRTRVRYTDATWYPSTNDIGSHIACFTAVDNTGVESIEEKCFILNVKAERFNHTYTSSTGGMSFVDVPSPADLVLCPRDTTCVLPIFVRSLETVVKIDVAESFSEMSSTGNVTLVQHNGESVYKADLSFTHSMNEKVKICVQATDEKGTKSDIVCIQSEIEAPDPCLSAPCHYGGRCMTGGTSGSFVCVCANGYKGTTCEIKPDNCNPNPCNLGACFPVIPNSYTCYCKDKQFKPIGYTGEHCETNIDDCANKNCSGQGICVDGIMDYTCDCFDRYSGKDCQTDGCVGVPATRKTCPIADCIPDPCLNGAVCMVGPQCQCRLGNEGTRCGTWVGDVSTKVTGVKFYPPTPKDGSKLTCYIQNGTVIDCPFTIFLASSSGTAPTIQDQTSQGLQQPTITGVTTTNLLQGIDHLFTATVTIKGEITDKTNNFICLTASANGDTDKLCLDIEFGKDPMGDQTSKDYLQKDASTKFLPPTPLANTRFMCHTDETCFLLLYTTYKPTCEYVMTSSTGVTVMSPRADGARACVTEVAYRFASDAEKDICFLSSGTDYQERCFKVDVYQQNKEPCASSACQNGAQCFTTAHDQFKCICTDGYLGDKCEKGPCPTNNCNNGGYCLVDNFVTTCLCPAGYSGPTCATDSSSVNAHPQTNGAVIDETTKPLDVNCNKNLPCGASLLLAGAFSGNDGPIVSPGYISPEIILQDIEIADRGAGSYELGVLFIAKQVGEFMICMQTLNNARVNRDEVCFKVHVTSGVSTRYGFTDRLHYVLPSPPTGTTIECTEDKPCHMIYHVTPGIGREHECVKVSLTDKGDFKNIYPFTTCEPCTSGMSTNGNCTIDISLIPDGVTTHGHEKLVCVVVGLENNATIGEERCFKVSVVAAASNTVSYVVECICNTTRCTHILPISAVCGSGENMTHCESSSKQGCQSLHCENGGFCNGQNPAQPVCYCTKGYTGNTCDQLSTGSSSTGGTGTQTESFIGDSAIISDVRCGIGCQCPIPLHVVGKAANIVPSVSLGFVDPRLDVSPPTLNANTGTTRDYSGVVNIEPTEVGSFKMCIQINDAGTIDDDMCFTIHVTGPCSHAVDTTKPHFLSPTLPNYSTVLCQNGTTCHLDIHFTNGEEFGLSNVCPNLKESSSTAIDGMHIFTAKHDVTECTADVSYRHHVSVMDRNKRTLCLKVSLPGKQGEERCFTLQTVDDIERTVSNPCKGTTCENGVCVENVTSSTGMCACTMGFTDSNCSTPVQQKQNLPGVVNPPTTHPEAPHFSTVHAIPQTTECLDSLPCNILVPFTGDSDKPPVTGYIDPDLNKTNETVITPDSVNYPQQHVLVTTVTGHIGSHMVCFQTTADGTSNGENVDELCLTANVKPPGTSSPPPDPNKPKFSTFTPTSNSSFICLPNTNCFLTFVTEKSTTGHCTQVRQCGPDVKGVYVFVTRSLKDHCVTDVSYTSGDPGTETLCIKAGNKGEERQYSVETKAISAFGPCQKLHCQNGAKCLANNTTSSTCVCAKGYTGTTCATDIDECLSGPCQNVGICTNEIGHYRCDCMSGYKGSNCEITIQTTTQVSVAGNSHATKTLEDIIKTACTATEWKISINMADMAVLYPMVNSSNIYLGAKNCTGVLHGNDLVFQKGIRDCQTREQISDDILRFENELFCASFDPTHPFIIHQFQWTYNVECDVRRQETSSSHVHHVSTSHHSTANANYNISTQFYMDPNLEHQIPGNPLNVNIGETVYVKVLASTSDWSIKMRLHTCYTKPSGSSTDLMTYTLIKDGCEVDRNTHIISQSAHETTFVYQDFVYASDHEGLDLYCNATICDVTDYSSNCMQVCHASPPLVG